MLWRLRSAGLRPATSFGISKVVPPDRPRPHAEPQPRGGTARRRMGQGLAADVALEHNAWAMRLSPLDPLMFSMQQVTALAHDIARRYAEAATWAEQAFREQPNHRSTIRMMAACHALCGGLEEPHKAIAGGRELDPSIRICNLKDRVIIPRILRGTRRLCDWAGCRSDCVGVSTPHLYCCLPTPPGWRILRCETAKETIKGLP